MKGTLMKKFISLFLFVLLLFSFGVSLSYAQETYEDELTPTLPDIEEEDVEDSEGSEDSEEE
ncbi:MAG: hypothetical protein HYR97_00235 [Candidatus Melainabacteria bacterium]|nr:hypothetical protein [Candidatus Melainabacteria bacterium]MBI3308808.1 hypothetical protein [Candidatus Melainabacteria bacterium]